MSELYYISRLKIYSEQEMFKRRIKSACDLLFCLFLFIYLFIQLFYVFTRCSTMCSGKPMDAVSIFMTGNYLLSQD